MCLPITQGSFKNEDSDSVGPGKGWNSAFLASPLTTLWFIKGLVNSGSWIHFPAGGCSSCKDSKVFFPNWLNN